MIYLDTCVLIYLVEPRSASHVRATEAVARSRDDMLAISPLVMTECLVGPLGSGDEALRQDFERSFATLRLVPLSAAVGRRAAELRATHRLKTPDALHLAAALESGCSEIWTNDDRLSRAAGGLARVVGR